MQQRDYSPDERAERRQLLWLAVGLGTAATVMVVFAKAWVVPVILVGFGLTALAGVLNYRGAHRDIFLWFTVLSGATGYLVSRMVMLLMYVSGIVLVGGLLKLFGMNRLQRQFARCRSCATMFEDAPGTSVQCFGRQS